MKNLLFVVQALNVGGSSILVCDLARKFANAREYKVTLLVFFDLIDDKYSYINDIDNLTVITLNKKKLVDFSFAKRLKKTVEEIKPDIISSHLSCIAYLKTFCNLDGMKLFHTVHNLPKKDLPWIYREIIRSDVKKGRIRLIGISDMIARLSSKEYGIPFEKIPIAYNGIELPNEIHETKKDFDFLCVGRFVSWKKFPNLVKCFSELNPQQNKLKLALCGYGPDRENILKAIEEKQLQDYVEIFDSTYDTNDLYKRSKVFCLFSSVEGNPIVILEAMSYGLPIISTYTGGIPDVVQNKVNGFLFNYEDLASGVECMKNVLFDKELYCSMSNESLKLVKKYSIDNTYIAYRGLFEE